MEALVYLVIVLVLLALGLITGSLIESAHFRRLARDEQELSQIVVSDMCRLPANWQGSAPRLVVGQVVIATDYFKVFAAALRKLFGGRMVGYERLAERARREAVVRMLREARNQGANVVWNVRLETSTVGGQQSGRPGGVEIMAYGTAMLITAEPYSA